MEPIVLEALMWSCLILGSPAIYWLFSTLASVVSSLLFPGKIVEITYTDDNGHVVTTKLALDDDDELVKILLQAGKGQGVKHD